MVKSCMKIRFCGKNEVRETKGKLIMRWQFGTDTTLGYLVARYRYPVDAVEFIKGWEHVEC
jgi:hypothetical protein